MSKKRKPTTKLYDVPAGATIKLLTNNNHYIAVCAHPDRAPWLVTHDGREVAIEPDPSANAPP